MVRLKNRVRVLRQASTNTADPTIRLMALQLRDSINIPNSISGLRPCTTELRNIVGLSPGVDVAIHQNTYLNVVDKVEAQLRNVFMDPTVWNHLYGDRYWIIYAAGEATPRPIMLINGEAETQARYIDSLVNQLEHLGKWLDATDGEMAVLDTHVLLHFQPPEQVDWKTVTGTDTVRIILPLRVIEELDMSKYRERDDIADRARRLLSQLWALLSPTAGGPVKIREGVTIEVPVDDGPRQRTLDADQEILNQCLMLKAVGQAVRLISDDTGLSIRATAQEVTVIPMPEHYLRKKVKVAEAADTNSQINHL